MRFTGTFRRCAKQTPPAASDQGTTTMIASRASGDRRVIATFADSAPKEMYIPIFSGTGTDNGTYSAYDPCRAEAAPSAVSNHRRTLWERGWVPSKRTQHPTGQSLLY